MSCTQKCLIATVSHQAVQFDKNADVESNIDVISNFMHNTAGANTNQSGCREQVLIFVARRQKNIIASSNTVQNNSKKLCKLFHLI